MSQNAQDDATKSSKSLWSGMKRTLKKKGSATNLYTVKKEPDIEPPVPALQNEPPKQPAGRGRSVSSFTVNDAQDFISSQPIVIPKARKKPQFGIHPTNLLTRYPDEPVPAVVVSCVEVLETDIMKEGVFRIPGRMTDILEMKISFEQGRGLGTDQPDTYAVAGLLSQFFRELPEPLMTYKLYNDWIDATKNPETVVKRLSRLIVKLPAANFNLLKYFIEFLGKVSKCGGANRMGKRNLALVFGASLLNPPDDQEYDLNNIKAQCEVIEHLISDYDFIFDGIENQTNSSTPRVEKKVATIPAGMGGTSMEIPTRRKKRSLLDRTQLSNSLRLASSLDDIQPKPKPKLISNLSMSTNAITSRCVKPERKKKRKEK